MGSVCLWAVLRALAVLDLSISAATSEWPSQHPFIASSALLDPGIISGASVAGPAFHCWPKLARQGLVWLFSWLPACALCTAEPCVGFPQPPRALPLCRGIVSSRLPSARHVCSFSPRLALCAARVVCLERFVCLPTLGDPSWPAVPWGSLWASLSPLSPPSGWGHSLQAVHGLRSATFSVSCPNSLLCPVFQDPIAPHCARLQGSFPCAQELLLFQGAFPPSGHKLPSRSSQSFPFLCLYLLSCPPGGLGSSAMAQGLLCRSCSIP